MCYIFIKTKKSNTF